MRKDFGIAWAVKRELEIRARQPASYRGFDYAGPVMTALLLTVPIAGMVVTAGGVVPRDVMVFAFTVAAFPYCLYLIVAGAGMVAGSLNVDRRVAGRLPVSPLSHLAGKLVGSLLALWVEILSVMPLLLLASWLMTDSVKQGALLVVLLAWQVLLGGLLGAARFNRFAAARDAGRQARSWAWLFLLLYPCLMGILVVLWGAPPPVPCPHEGVPHASGAAVLHAMLAAFFVHPMGALSVLGAEAAVAPGAMAAMSASAVLFVVALGKVRAALL